MRRIVAVIAVLVLAGALGACGQDEADMAGDGGASEGGAQEGLRRDLNEGGGGGGSVAADEVAQISLPTVGPRVIKTATLGVEVPRDGLSDAIQDAVAIAETAGGFVLSTELSDERSGRGTVVVRVPSEDFEAALSDLGDIGDVERRGVRGEDVSEEFVDLEARLRNYEAQEAVLLRLMDDATTIGETIRVQNELTGIQLEIERIKGRLRFLDDRTSLGTITVSLHEAGAVVPRDPMLAKAWRQAGEAFLAVVGGVIVGLGVLVPVALLAGIALVAYRALRPRLVD